jgi:hypothetical protein
MECGPAYGLSKNEISIPQCSASKTLWLQVFYQKYPLIWGFAAHVAMFKLTPPFHISVIAAGAQLCLLLLHRTSLCPMSIHQVGELLVHTWSSGWSTHCPSPEVHLSPPWSSKSSKDHSIQLSWVTLVTGKKHPCYLKHGARTLLWKELGFWVHHTWSPALPLAS